MRISIMSISTYLAAAMQLTRSVAAYNTSVFSVSNPSFDLLLGPQPAVTVLASSDEELFHEGGVYHSPTKALWVGSDKLKTSDNQTVRYLQRITGLDSPSTVNITIINTTMPDPIGGLRYVPDSPLGDVIIWVCGGLKSDSPPAGLYAMNPYAPYNTSLLLGSFGTYPFNSPDDLTVTSDGVIWFTDPINGYLEGTRGTAYLPNQVYAYDPALNDTRVVADQFVRPDGISHSPDGTIIYIGDIGADNGSSTPDFQGSRTVYAFDRKGGFLMNKRVFAFPNTLPSATDGIKADSLGNVWVATPPAPEVNVWNAEGTLLGKILLDGDLGNLGFGEPGELFVLGGKKLFKICVSDTVMGVGV